MDTCTSRGNYGVNYGIVQSGIARAAHVELYYSYIELLKRPDILQGPTSSCKISVSLTAVLWPNIEQKVPDEAHSKHIV